MKHKASFKVIHNKTVRFALAVTVALCKPVLVRSLRRHVGDFRHSFQHKQNLVTPKKKERIRTKGKTFTSRVLVDPYRFEKYMKMFIQQLFLVCFVKSVLFVEFVCLRL